MKTLTVPQRLIDMGLAVSGPKRNVTAALKKQETVLWLRANGSATLFYRGYSVPSMRHFLRQKSWARFTILHPKEGTP